MNKRDIITIIILLAIVCGVIVLHCFMPNAYWQGQCIIYKGEKYVEAGGYYEINKIVGHTDDGYVIYSIKGDVNKNYIEVSSFLDNYLYVKDDYSVDIEDLEAVCFGEGNEYTEDKEIIVFLKMLYSRPESAYKINLNDRGEDWLTIIGKYADDPIKRGIGIVIPNDDKYLFWRSNNHAVIELTKKEYSKIMEYMKY